MFWSQGDREVVVGVVEVSSRTSDVLCDTVVQKLHELALL